jgi:HEAT repeat protein
MDRRSALLALSQPQPLTDASRALVPLLVAGAKGRTDPIREMYFDALIHLRLTGTELASVAADPTEPVAIRIKAVQLINARSMVGEVALKEIVESPSAPIQVRLVAVRRLGTGCRSAVATLLRRIDDDAFLSVAAAEGLASLGRFEAMRSALHERDPLAAPFTPASAPRVVAGARELGALLDDPTHRPALLAALAEVGVPLVPTLISALGSPDVDLRRGAADALKQVKWGAKPAIPVLRAMGAGDPDPAARQAAAEALRAIGPTLSELTESFVRAQDAEARTRALADISLALKQLGAQSGEGVPALRNALGDASADVREETISALGMIGPPALGAVPEIVTRLRSDAQPSVRRSAAQALPFLHRGADERVRAQIVAALEAAEQDPDQNVRRSASQSLWLARSGPEPASTACEVAR